MAGHSRKEFKRALQVFAASGFDVRSCRINGERGLYDHLSVVARCPGHKFQSTLKKLGRIARDIDGYLTAGCHSDDGTWEVKVSVSSDVVTSAEAA